MIKKYLSFFLAVIVFVPLAYGEDASSLQNAFRQIPDKIYPSVVSITTIQIKKRTGTINDELLRSPVFEDFLQEFIGASPQGTTEKILVDKKVGIGTGIIVDSRGFILTNAHLVENAERGNITVRLSRGDEYSGLLVGVDEYTDLAIVKIDRARLPIVTFTEQDLYVGAWVAALGNPYGFIFEDAQPTMTVGIVSALNRSLPPVMGHDYALRDLIQTDAAINIGNSGGPLVNLEGEVVGLNTAVVGGPGGNSGVGFAISSEQCKEVVQRFVVGDRDVSTWLGVEAQVLTDDLAEFLRVSYDDGLVVTHVVKDSPAYNAGLRQQDVLVTWESEILSSKADMRKLLQETTDGDVIELGLIRKGRRLNVKVNLTRRPASIKQFEKIKNLYWRGMKPIELSLSRRWRYEERASTGITISHVEPGSIAAGVGIKVNDVIESVEHERIDSVAHFYEVVSEYDLKGVLLKTDKGFVVIPEA